jgi:hypothetical protein
MKPYSTGTIAPVSENITVVGWLRPTEESEWDVFVRQHPLGMVYQLSSWKRVLESAFPQIRGQFLVAREAETGRILAGLPVYTVKSWLLGNRIVSVPFATMCDPLLSSAEEFGRFLPELQALQQKTGSRRVEIRARLTANLLLNGGTLSGDVGFKHLYLPLNPEQDRDALFHTFSRTCVRKNITKAERAGVIVEQRWDEASMSICYDILVESRRRLSLPQMPYAFFKAMLAYLSPEHLNVFLALHKSKPIGCFILLRMGDFWTAEYAGSTADAPAGVDQMLYWETIKKALDHDAKIYSFGRTAVANEGLLTYKRRWATVEEDLVDFTFCARDEKLESVEKVHHSDSSLAYRRARTLLGKVPMPVYRMIGDFCYRHLG